MSWVTQGQSRHLQVKKKKCQHVFALHTTTLEEALQVMMPEGTVSYLEAQGH